MDSPIDFARRSEYSQLPSNTYNDAGHFDAAKFNKDDIGAIQKHKSNNDKAYLKKLSFDDCPVLLYILLETLLEDNAMSQQACEDYIFERPSLLTGLRRAYTSQDYGAMLSDADMPPQVAEYIQTIAPALTSSGDSHSLKDAFEAKYRGNTAELFIKTLNKERDSAFGSAGVDRPYNWSISVVQSSGMGKSRMVEESGNTVFTIPINIREKLSHSRMTYPPPDESMRQFFTNRQEQSDEWQQADYAILLLVLFTKSRELAHRLFPRLVGQELALAWAEYLKEEQTETKVGRSRQRFYAEVVEAAEQVSSIAKKAGGGLRHLERSLVESCAKLMSLIQSTNSGNTNACFMYFDDAHALMRSPQNPIEKVHECSQYQNLGTVLTKLVDYPVFFIFLSADSRLEDFAPTYDSHPHPSDRVIDGAQLIPPFTELPFDIYEESLLENVGSLTLENMCKTDAIVGFGRPLWNAHRKSNPTGDIFRFAMDKLSACEVPKREDDSLLAALGVRVGVTFDETNPNACSTQSRLVEWHLRIVHSIPRGRGYMHTGSPSEPVLAEAAGRYLHGSGRRGVTIEGPKLLSSALKTGLLVCEERAEIAGRLLVTSAYEIALNGIPRPSVLEPCFHRPIPPNLSNQADIDGLGAAFSGAYVYFSHFALAEDSGMLSPFGLATALVRGMAIRAPDGQESIDAVIPIHMGPLNTPISSKTTSAINLQIKNRKTNPYGSSEHSDLVKNDFGH
ncbi:hypothetical protein RSAG8_12230, partial [Rhizoctonia solani AG-8 WAC10335]